MRESPRFRRLKSDHKALTQLAAESTIFEFMSYGTPPDFHILRFRGRGFWKPDPQEAVVIRDEHEVHVRLGASYPRMMPELAWKSPIFHPNISASGVVCLGGYGTYWVPSLSLDELCGMLWDMIRYENYDETSPYNREAAAWAKNQTDFRLPIDNRPLRDKLAGGLAAEDLLPVATPVLPAKPSKKRSSHGRAPFRHQSGAQPSQSPARQVPARPAPSPAPPPSAVTDGVLFIGDVEVVEAQIVPPQQAGGDEEILFIE
jgi:Ubiquitin-conjugating enzyme